jgi:Tfp pilus assembly protein FimT
MTAVELLTLMMLLVILAAFAVPSIGPVVLRQRLSGAAWQLAGDLRLARQRAVTVRKRFRVCLTSCAISDIPAGSYSIERDDGTTSTPNWISETGVPVRLPLNVTVTATGTATFTTTGMASGSTFSVCNITGAYQIAVASTGRVKVSQGTCP